MLSDENFVELFEYDPSVSEKVGRNKCDRHLISLLTLRIDCQADRS